MKLSVVLAAYNEEKNIGACLGSVKNISDEIVVVDGSSTDGTVEIAKSFGAKVVVVPNQKMFHINKQKALDLAKGEWILQLDADEKVTPELAKEIKKIIKMSQKKLMEHQKNLPEKDLFLRHEKLVAPSNQRSDKDGSYVAFFVPRLNYFLGKFLRYGGLYPDGAIRLVKKDKAHFPCRDVHEVMTVDGRVGWLQNPLLHYDSPTFKRYLERNNRYINLMVSELQQQKLEKNFINFINFILYKPIVWFFSTQIRHKGILDGWQGVVFSLFSALRFPRAYIKYLTKKN